MEPTAIEYQNTRKVLKHLYANVDIYFPTRLIELVEELEKKAFIEENK